PEPPARGRLDLLHRLVALEGVERLALRHGRAVLDEPSRQDALVHREAELGQDNFRGHALFPSVVRTAAAISSRLYRNAFSSGCEKGTGQERDPMRSTVASSCPGSCSWSRLAISAPAP